MARSPEPAPSVEDDAAPEPHKEFFAALHDMLLGDPSSSSSSSSSSSGDRPCRRLLASGLLRCGKRERR